ncbi:MAG: GNAT family N-acetyltransferase [Methanoregulaceae archaeon]|nr:GNAT family N-acetyltransferase [Methanoregulaceae archaeon]
MIPKEVTHVQFIPATRQDLPSLNSMVNDPEVSRYLNLIPPVPMESTLAFWDRVESGQGKVWCIHGGGGIIGCAGIWPNQPGTKIAHTAAFFLYLKPAWWGRGIGDLAMHHLETQALAKGFLRLECHVAAGNARAIRLYERHGFVREGLMRRAFLDGNQFSDLVMMGKVW